jgi:hypothetical protein
VADGDGGEPDAHVARVRHVEQKIFEDEGLAELTTNGGLDGEA